MSELQGTKGVALLPDYASASDSETEAVGVRDAKGQKAATTSGAPKPAEMAVIYGKDLRQSDWHYDPNAPSLVGPGSSKGGGFDRVSRSRHQLGYIAEVAKDSEAHIIKTSQKAAEERKATKTRYGW